MNRVEETTQFVMCPSPGSYAMFLPPDMSSVKLFRKELRHTLSENNFPRENIMQIELAADEALTNSISASVCNCSEETIICRWRIEGSKFTLNVLDYGAGLKGDSSLPDNDPELLKSNSPLCLATFINNIRSHQNLKPECLPYNGSSQKHKNMGKGLKIISAIMDSVMVLFHGEGVVCTSPKGFKVMGSILTLEYDSAKH